VDRDSRCRARRLEDTFARCARARSTILVGTQMLAKGTTIRTSRWWACSRRTRALQRGLPLGERLFAARAGRRARRQGRAAGRSPHPDRLPSASLYAAVARHDYARFAARRWRSGASPGFPPSRTSPCCARNRRAPARRRPTCDARASAGAVGRVEVFDPVARPSSARPDSSARSSSCGPLARRAPAVPRRMEGGARRARDRRVRWSLDVDPQEV
jgi:primosomal protein N'